MYLYFGILQTVRLKISRFFIMNCRYELYLSKESSMINYKTILYLLLCTALRSNCKNLISFVEHNIITQHGGSSSSISSFLQQYSRPFCFPMFLNLPYLVISCTFLLVSGAGNSSVSQFPRNLLSIWASGTKNNFVTAMKQWRSLFLCMRRPSSTPTRYTRLYTTKVPRTTIFLTKLRDGGSRKKKDELR